MYKYNKIFQYLSVEEQVFVCYTIDCTNNHTKKWRHNNERIYEKIYTTKWEKGKNIT